MGSNNSGSVERAYLIRGPGLEGKKKKKKAGKKKNKTGCGCGNLAVVLVMGSIGGRSTVVRG